MTDQQKSLRDAIAEHGVGDPAAGQTRALQSWRTGHDDGLEKLGKLRREDPAAYQAMRPTSADLFYSASHAATTEAWRWDSTFELALAQRVAGANFSDDMEKAIDRYAAGRAHAESHGQLEAARRRAEKGATR